MSQYDDDDDDFNDVDDNSINAIRKALRAAEKRAKALEQELSTYRTEARQRTLQGALEAKGLNPKVAAFVPADVTVDGIGAWLDEYGSLFAPQGETAPPAQQETEVPPGAAAFTQVTSTGTPATFDESQQIAMLQGAKTTDEILRLIGQS